MLRKIDYDYPQMEQSGYQFPVVEIYLRYANAARFGQVVLVRADVLEYENRLKIGYLLTDAASGQRLIKGHSVQVAVHAATHELQFVSPAVLLDKVKAAR